MLLTPYFRNGGMIGTTLDFNATDRYVVPSEGGSPIEYVGSVTQQGVGTTANITLDFSSLNPQVGDFVLVVFGQNATYGPAPYAYKIADTTEISNLYYDVALGQDGQTQVGYRFYTGAANDNIATITGGTASTLEAYGLIVYVFRNVDSAVLDVPVLTATTVAGSASVQPPAITPSTQGAAVVAIASAVHLGGFSFYTVPGNLTNAESVAGNDSGDVSLAAGLVLDWTSGEVAPGTFTNSVADGDGVNSTGITIALRPTGGGGGGGGSGTVLTYQNNYAQEGSNQNPVTFSNADFGTEAADRYIIVGYTTRNDSRTINSVTIGGVSATILVQQADGNTTTGMAMAAVPTGTSGDVVVTLDGNADAHYLGVWAATGLASATPVATATSQGNGSDAGAQSFTMNTDANGFVIVVDGSAAGGNGPENPATVSANLTLRYDGVTTTPDHTTGASAGADGLTDGTSTTFEITIGDTNNNNPAVAATFAGTTGGGGGGGGTTEGNLKNSGIWDVTGILDSFITGTGGGGGGNYELGLSPSLLTISGASDAWTQQTVDISAYAGATARLVFRYQNGAGFEGDIQLDAIDLDGNFYTFELSNSSEGFETSTADDSPTYAGVTWAAVANQSNVDGYWQVDQGGTPSNNTGRTDAADGSYYVYAETSSPANVLGYNFWLRSPEVTLSGAPTLTFFEARTGGNIGTLDVHLDVIS